MFVVLMKLCPSKTQTARVRVVASFSSGGVSYVCQK